MIKPRVFIGSSSERLDIAYAIQENLEYDSETTVWTQDIFNLSKSTLTNLMESLNKFDYAIFVFHPDDMLIIRQEKYDVVRDNLIFELGLFMGHLGQENVFFLVPRTSEGLHLPTDLLGITPGKYDSERIDGNLKAALGPFCSQVRKILEDFVYLSLEGFKTESKEVKSIILKKPAGWEYKLALALLEKHIKTIDETYKDIEDEFVIQKTKTITGEEFFDWFKNLLENYRSFISLFVKCLRGLQDSFGPPGEPGKPIEIKNSVEKLVAVCNEIIELEKELLCLNPPEKLHKTKLKIKGASKSLIINPLKNLEKRLREVIDQVDGKIVGDNQVSIVLTPVLPEGINSVLDDYRDFLGL